MNSFRGKTDLLCHCDKDIKLLIRAGYHKKMTHKIIRLDNAISLESSMMRYYNLEIDFAKSGA